MRILTSILCVAYYSTSVSNAILPYPQPNPGPTSPYPSFEPLGDPQQSSHYKPYPHLHNLSEPKFPQLMLNPSFLPLPEEVHKYPEDKNFPPIMYKPHHHHEVSKPPENVEPNKPDNDLYESEPGVRPPQYYENLKAAQKLMVDLLEDTHLEGPPSILDQRVHFNTLLGVILALAERKLPVCDDFDTYFDENYEPTVEQYYPQGIKDPKVLHKRIEIYTQILADKVKNIKNLIEICGELGPARCNVWVFFKVNTDLRSLRHEANLLEALADLAETYNRLSFQLHSVAEQYLELPYLLGNKGGLKELVRKLFVIIEYIVPQHDNPKCMGLNHSWLQVVPLKNSEDRDS